MKKIIFISILLTSCVGDSHKTVVSDRFSLCVRSARAADVRLRQGPDATGGTITIENKSVGIVIDPRAYYPKQEKVQPGQGSRTTIRLLDQGIYEVDGNGSKAMSLSSYQLKDGRDAYIVLSDLPNDSGKENIARVQKLLFICD